MPCDAFAIRHAGDKNALACELQEIHGSGDIQSLETTLTPDPALNRNLIP